MGTRGPGERSTICGEGCAMTSVSMALAGLGVDLADRAVRPCLQRWGLYDEIKAVRVRYDRKGKDEELVKGILTDEVRTALGLPAAEPDAAVRGGR